MLSSGFNPGLMVWWITEVLFILALSTSGLSKQDGRKGTVVGEACDGQCGGHNMICDSRTKTCQCGPNYPIVVNGSKETLCLKQAKVGEGCLSIESCLENDPNTDCVQEDMVAKCKCNTDFKIMYDKTSQKDLCVKRPVNTNSDLATLLGIGAGMTLFCGLTCLVLRMFARARFGPRRHHYGNAQLPPPITLSADLGETTRGASRNSSQRSSLAEGSRRQSKEGSLLAPPTRQGEGGSRRASNSSIRSTSSGRSQRSYSLRNPIHNNHLHQALQHRPSDPESRSQASQLNLVTSTPRPTSQDNVSGSGSQQKQHSPHQPIQKGKRSGSAGMLPV